MKSKLEEFISQNEQASVPQFFKKMETSKKRPGSEYFYSEKHMGSIQSFDYYKPISLIVPPFSPETDV